VARRKRLTLSFAPADCVVVADRLTGGEGGQYREDRHGA
jgi:hypothetical protein